MVCAHSICKLRTDNHDHQKAFSFFCFQPGATSQAVVLCAFHVSMYGRLQTNLNMKKQNKTKKKKNTAWYAKKTHFPYSLSLMSGCCSPPDWMRFYAAPILSRLLSHPLLSLHLSIRDHDWARMAGSQPSAMKARPVCPSSFSWPLASWSFSTSCSLWPPLHPYQNCLSTVSWKSHPTVST